MKGTNEFLSGMTGRLENMVVYRLRSGDTCVRSKGAAFNDARSDLQLQGRNRFRDVTRRSSALKLFLRDHFALINPNGSGYHSFIRVNMSRGKVDISSQARSSVASIERFSASPCPTKRASKASANCR